MEQLIGIGVAIFLSYLVLVGGSQEQTNRKQGENDSQRMTNRPVRKTIQTKDGDVFDCIDINRQPAFDHPLLKDHEIQMKPSSYPTRSHEFSSEIPATESQLPIIACPAGTIPIMQNNKTDLMTPLRFDTMGDVDLGAEFAGIRTRDEIYGIKVSINIYETEVKGNADRSASWTTVANGQQVDRTEAIGAGSIVWPSFSGDSFARFHITWAVGTQNYQACYDHGCPGFVQVSQVGVGARLQPVSVYNGPQYQLDLLLYKEPVTKNWWVVGPNQTPIGYWPSSIFTDMKEKAIGSFSGGFVDGPTYKSNPSPMGSGQFANEGYRKAAFVKNLQILTAENHFITPDTPNAVAGTTRKECYTVDNFSRGDDGLQIFFGGPGGCNN